MIPVNVNAQGASSRSASARSRAAPISTKASRAVTRSGRAALRTNSFSCPATALHGGKARDSTRAGFRSAGTVRLPGRMTPEHHCSFFAQVRSGPAHGSRDPESAEPWQIPRLRSPASPSLGIVHPTCAKNASAALARMRLRTMPFSVPCTRFAYFSYQEIASSTSSRCMAARPDA